MFKGLIGPKKYKRVETCVTRKTGLPGRDWGTHIYQIIFK